MVTPLVTIIVPVYNLESYVAHGLKSLLAQTYSHLQIIVIDDASSDRSPQIVTRFAQRDRRIQAILKPVNQGVSAARNSGLEQARVSWLRLWTEMTGMNRTSLPMPLM